MDNLTHLEERSRRQGPIDHADISSAHRLSEQQTTSFIATEYPIVLNSLSRRGRSRGQTVWNEPTGGSPRPRLRRRRTTSARDPLQLLNLGEKPTSGRRAYIVE